MTSAPSRPERGDSAAKPAGDKQSVATRPSADDKEGGAVTLKPTKQKDKYGRVRSFDERLGEVFEQKKAKIAREKQERQAKMERAVGAATDKHR